MRRSCCCLRALRRARSSPAEVEQSACRRDHRDVRLPVNVAFHVEAHVHGVADIATRFAVALVITLVSLIGGRIVPSFTRNWLARANPGRMPEPFGRFDALVIAASVIALLSWIAAPGSARHRRAADRRPACCTCCALRAGPATARLRDRLVLILHLAYAFIPAGYILSGLAAFDVVPASAGIHAWTGGAIGSMTLAVMTRATLGHTGQLLRASRRHAIDLRRRHHRRPAARLRRDRACAYGAPARRRRPRLDLCLPRFRPALRPRALLAPRGLTGEKFLFPLRCRNEGSCRLLRSSPRYKMEKSHDDFRFQPRAHRAVRPLRNCSQSRPMPVTTSA